MTRVPLYLWVEIVATQADVSLGVGPEIARPALRRRLAGEARHLHKKTTPPRMRTTGSGVATARWPAF
jgi:hypothetical protein